jgi:hypothetical protein
MGRNAVIPALQITLIGLNIKFISKHSVNSMLMFDKMKKKGVIK